ncbi:D-alanine--D-alanine ligase [uncultured Ruminococcus sp.]|uniref:D-alanine--D-alanine ligase family protein n=1 Tax=uncultured Ruminococcus sp. TaxID=165186 RepID=UPI00292DA68F|nr:D-alanine--D-alanine ligase [uncultured Ruminococcus sp.]
MRIAVLAGGLSSERDVSILSGSKIAQALRTKGHQVALIDIYMGYEADDFDADRLFEENYDFTTNAAIAEEAPDIEKVKKSRKNQSNDYFGDHVIELCKAADITFLGLHGGEGEDGSVQAALKLYGIKYTGSDSLGAAIAMHKGVTKGIFLNSNVPTPKSKLYKREFMGEGYLDSWTSFPCVVKPCSAGSSVGVQIVADREQFVAAVGASFRYDDDVLVEEYIKGREFSVGILGGKALPVIEIIPKSGWYDYANKYQEGATEEICPAELDEKIAEKMQREAEHAFEMLRLKVYGRVDFLLDSHNRFYCLEANTLPGMTPMSLLPQEAAAAGIAYPELCEKIIELSLEK